jgi:hypothetical protein
MLCNKSDSPFFWAFACLATIALFLNVTCLAFAPLWRHNLSHRLEEPVGFAARTGRFLGAIMGAIAAVVVLTFAAYASYEIIGEIFKAQVK